MILDGASISILGPDGKLTPAERNRRAQLNLCLRCGKSGHRSWNCKQPSHRLQELKLVDGMDVKLDLGKA